MSVVSVQRPYATVPMLMAGQDRPNHFGIAVGLLFALPLGLGLPMWPIWFAATCITLLTVSILNVTSGICLFLLLCPLTVWFRNGSPLALMLSGSRSIWLAIVVVCWLLAVARKDRGFARGPDVVAIALFLGVGLAKWAATGSFLAGFLGFREIVAPAMIYLVVRWAVTCEPRVAIRIVRYVLLSTVLVLVLQVLWYKGHLVVETARRFAESSGQEGVLSGGGGRVVLGHYFERMNSLIGGGPSNAGIFLGAGMWLAVAVAVRQGVGAFRRLLLLVIGAGLAYGAFLSLSRSVVVLTFGVVAVYVISRYVPAIVRTLALVVGFLLFMGVVVGKQFADITLIETIQTNSTTWLRAIPTGMMAVFGGPLESAGGRLVRFQDYYGYVDAGWITVWAMLGLPGMIVMGVFLMTLMRSCWILARGTSGPVVGMDLHRVGLVSAAVAMGLLIGSPHTAIIIRGPSAVMFYALTAVAVALARHARSLDGGR